MKRASSSLWIKPAIKLNQPETLVAVGVSPCKYVLISIQNTPKLLANTPVGCQPVLVESCALGIPLTKYACFQT